MMDYIYVYKRDANGDTEYSKCIVNQIRDPQLNNFAIVSNNNRIEDRVSNIDIEGIFFKNWDAEQY
jgi:hypothetical protein